MKIEDYQVEAAYRRLCAIQKHEGEIIIGLVDWWRGELQPDGVTVKNGTRYYAIG